MPADGEPACEGESIFDEDIINSASSEYIEPMGIIWTYLHEVCMSGITYAGFSSIVLDSLRC
jgi:hypothetical protein